MISRSDEYILLTVWRLQNIEDGAYVSSVLEHLQTTSTGPWSIAGVYAPLKRLARNGLLISATGRPTPERGGRSKRLYKLTAKGLSVLSASRQENAHMWAGLLSTDLSELRLAGGTTS